MNHPIRILSAFLVLAGLYLVNAMSVQAGNEKQPASACCKKSTGCAEKPVLLFDLNHGQGFFISEEGTPNRWMKGQLEITEKTGINLVPVTEKLSTSLLSKGDILAVLMPTEGISDEEIDSVCEFVDRGGALLVVQDEERRQKIAVTRMNELLVHFGMQLTGDTAYIHNRGAIARKGEINNADRELPYSGGRAITGGNSFSYIVDEEESVHAAWFRNDAGGKVIVMAEGMATLLLGEPEGVRLTGTTVEDTHYWGRDSRIFMQEVYTWLATE